MKIEMRRAGPDDEALAALAGALRVAEEVRDP
jgi:hypothetical protein